MSESPKSQQPPRAASDPLTLVDQLVEAIGTEQARIASAPDPRNVELAPTPALIDAINGARDGVKQLLETIDLAWGLIANAGDGDWSKESALWQQAAVRWRDQHYLGSQAQPSDAERDLQQRAVVEHDRLEADPDRPELAELDNTPPAPKGYVHIDHIVKHGTVSGFTTAPPALEGEDPTDPARRVTGTEIRTEREAHLGDVGAELDGGPARG